MGRPKDAAGIAIPPGQYAVLVGGLPMDESIAFYKKYLRDQQPIDPSKVPIITLIDGQITDLDLSWAEWRPRLLDYSPALRDRETYAQMDALRAAGVGARDANNNESGLYLPPGLLPDITVERPPPASTTPAPAPPSKP